MFNENNEDTKHPTSELDAVSKYQSAQLFDTQHPNSTRKLQQNLNVQTHKQNTKSKAAKVAVHSSIAAACNNIKSSQTKTITAKTAKHTLKHQSAVQLPLIDKPPAAPKNKKATDSFSGHRERVRQKVLSSGASSLLDYELLELFLFSSYRQMDTKKIAKQLLHHFENLANVFSADSNELVKVEGVGEHTVTHILAVKELILRILLTKVKEKPVLDNWEAVMNYLLFKLSHESVEYFSVIFLDPHFNLLEDKIMATGTVDKTPVYPREIAKEALALGATSVILVHNHPSSSVKPSEADLRLTQQIVSALAALHIRVEDHVIVGRNKAFSFSNQGLL